MKKINYIILLLLGLCMSVISLARDTIHDSQDIAQDFPLNDDKDHQTRGMMVPDLDDTNPQATDDASISNYNAADIQMIGHDKTPYVPRSIQTNPMAFDPKGSGISGLGTVSDFRISQLQGDKMQFYDCFYNEQQPYDPAHPPKNCPQ